MRTVCLLFLLLFVAAVGLFAYQNNYDSSVTFADRKWELPFPALVGLVYLLGMLSGWTVVGMVRRSWRTAVEDRP